MQRNSLFGGYFKNKITEGFIRYYNERNKSKLIDSILSFDTERLKNSLELANQIMDEISRSIKELKNPFDAVLDLKFVLKSPGLTGIASGLLYCVFEVGLNIDWVLGLPFYPASTIKGAVRELLTSLIGEEMAEAIFGTAGEEGYKGSVEILDSYPIGCAEGWPCLIYTGGVVTPHYFDRGRWVEREYEAMPSPHQHIVIASGTVFRLVAGINCPSGPDEDMNLKTMEKIIKLVTGKEIECRKERGKCSCMRYYALSLGNLFAEALAKGFAARRGKGYNVLELYAGGISRIVHSISVYVQAPQVGGVGRGSRR